MFKASAIETRPLLTATDVSEGTASFDDVLAAARRQIYVVVLAMAAFVGLAAAYTVLATKQYTASVNLILDPRSFAQAGTSTDQANMLLSGTAVDSQVEVIKSLKIAEAVMDRLGLMNDAELTSSSTLGKVLAAVSGGADPAPDVVRNRVVDALGRRLVVSRVNKSFVIGVDFTSRDPTGAARIANAFADEFVTDQVESRAMYAKRSSGWLEERLSQIRNEAMQADSAVQQFREKNNLVLAGGRLVGDQQLSELNAQLANTRVETYRAQARFERLQQIIANREVDAAVAETLSSPVIVDLRQKSLVAAKRGADLAERLGPNHAQVQSQMRESANFENQIFSEVNRVKESYRSDLDIARAREASLADQIGRLTGAASVGNRLQVQLDQLLRESEGLRTVYQAYLGKFQEMVQQTSSPVSEVRVIARAVAPSNPSAPRPLIILPLALVAGLAVGAGIGLVREHRDRTVRRGDQLRGELGLDFLGAIPLADGDAVRGPNGVFDAVLRLPFSRLSDTLRTVKVVLDTALAATGPKVIGVVSAASNEGKSTVSTNLATLIAAGGARTLLIDADLRRSGISARLARSAPAGLSDVLDGRATFESATLPLFVPDLTLLPCPPGHPVPNSSALLGSDRMRELIATHAADFDYIVVDLPPLNALVDARAIAPLLSATLLVVAWGETPVTVLREALIANEAIGQKCIGAVLNKVDLSRIHRYTGPTELIYGYQAY